MSDPRPISRGGIIHFLKRNDLVNVCGEDSSFITDDWSATMSPDTRSDYLSAANDRQRSQSVVIDVETVGNYPSSYNDSPPIVSQSEIIRCGRSTPMGELLFSQLSSSFYRVVEEGDSREEEKVVRSRKVGPEEFLEMLKRKRNAESVPSFGRRRTVSENQASMYHKMNHFLKMDFVSETKHSLVSRHASLETDTSPSVSGGWHRRRPENSWSLHASLLPDVKTKKKFYEDPMSNFPKFNVGSPTSPLNDFATSPSEHLILWKEANKEDKIIKFFDTHSSTNFKEANGTVTNVEKMVEIILKNHTAYDIMPNCSRCVVLDLRLKVGSAFDALAYDGIHAAPLWDDQSRSYVGMLTMSNFIEILQQHLEQPEVLASIKNDQICKWRDHLLYGEQSSFCGLLTTSVDSSLEEVASNLLTNKIHRLLVIDPVTNNALFLATHRQLLKYIWPKLTHSFDRNSFDRLFHKSIEELKIGSYENLVSVSSTTPVSEIFSILLTRRLSAIPVVDEDFCVIDIFRKADVMSLILDENLDDLYCPVGEILDYERNGFEGLYKCKKADSAYNVISSFVLLEIHRVIVVDDDGRLEGVISSSDLLRFLLRFLE